MLTFRNIIFLLLVSDVTFGRFLDVDMKKCLKRNGVFPKIGSYCKSYYKCTNWIPVEITCPEDELFNPISGWCDWIEAFTCLDRPKREECPRENGKFLKPGTKCKKYYSCCNGEPTELTCPRDTLFDPENEKCEWPELYTCVEEPKRKECPENNGYFLKTGTNCQQYYHCINWKPTVKNCPEGQIFDPSAGRCEWMELYTCIESISTKTIISSTLNPLRSSTNEDKPIISTETTNHETSQDPELSSPQTTFDPYTQSSTDEDRISTIITEDSTYYETSENPELSSPRTTFDPYTQTITDEERISTIVTDDRTYYETSEDPELSSPQTTFDPYTQSSTDEDRFSSIITEDSTYYETSENPELSSPRTTFYPYTRTITNEERISSIVTEDITYYETSQDPELSSPRTTFDPYTETFTDEERISTIVTSYETSQDPDDSSVRTASDIENQFTKEEKSSSSYTSMPDYKTSQHPESSSHQTLYPYTRSSSSEITESTNSYGTFEPNTKSTSTFVEETHQPVDIWCPKPSGYFPHPTDKHKFVACIDGKPTEMDCPSNLVYNHKVKRCDYK